MPKTGTSRIARPMSVTGNTNSPGFFRRVMRHSRPGRLHLSHSTPARLVLVRLIGPNPTSVCGTGNRTSRHRCSGSVETMASLDFTSASENNSPRSVRECGACW